MFKVIKKTNRYGEEKNYLECDEEPASESVALDTSILKWQTIVDFIDKEKKVVVDMGQATCALCFFYYAYGNMDECSMRCPVYRFVGVPYCSHTPYTDYSEAVDDNDVTLALVHAEAELEFLKGLREHSKNQQP